VRCGHPDLVAADSVRCGHPDVPQIACARPTQTAAEAARIGFARTGYPISVGLADLVLAAALVMGAAVTMLMYRSLREIYRASDGEQRHLLLTRGLPILGVVLVPFFGGAIVGAATGHGAFAGALVAAAICMVVAVPLLVVLPLIQAFRSSRSEH
jgi:hypothetical protein